MLMQSVHPGSAMPPMLLHTSSQVESHFHSLRVGKKLVLHAHNSGPYLPGETLRDMQLVVLADGQCMVTSLELQIDLLVSAGRCATRYSSAVLVWGVGVAVLLMAISSKQWLRTSKSPTSDASSADHITDRFPRVSESIGSISLHLKWALPGSFALGMIPLGPVWFLGTSGDLTSAILAPFIVLISVGYAIVATCILSIVTSFLSLLQPRQSTCVV